MEDAPQIATFNYLKIGFSEPPTSYYLRPFSLAIEKDIKNNCYLNETEIEVKIKSKQQNLNKVIVQKMNFNEENFFES